MSKHASTERSGSVLDLFTRTSKKGRHAQPKKLSAATVIDSGRRTPVMAAIAVPTAAIAAVAVAGVVGAPQGSSTASGEPFVQPETMTVEQPVAPKAENSKEYKDAKKQAKSESGSAEVTLPEPEPVENSSSSSSSSTSSTTSSSENSGSASDASAGDDSGDYSSPMSTEEIKAMLGGPGSRWYKIAQCESTFNPRAINKQNNAHFGLFQFKLATWQSVGGKGNPIDAHPREQFKRAKILQAKAGWGQWACA